MSSKPAAGKPVLTGPVLGFTPPGPFSQMVAATASQADHSCYHGPVCPNGQHRAGCLHESCAQVRSAPCLACRPA